MKVSREKMAENRTRILEQAGRLFRERGFEAVSVAEVMKSAGMTHGGFYGHFASKDDLIAESLAHMLTTSLAEPRNFERFADAYLSDAHRANASTGCPTAALASETAHRDPAARAAMTAGLKMQLDRMGGSAPGTDHAMARREAIGRWSAMVGAVILARACDDPALASELLSETRAWIGREFLNPTIQSSESGT
ncbi:helix-turn-helix domain-containing protein [Aminobacter sp. BA135]|uniref:TetR/AcrR family transcriptional regulator n=1 Tax=Aminobacter sp. BA135 TaxID=537596 RepID=UPI003D7AD5E5